MNLEHIQKSLCDFIDACPTMFHAESHIASILKQAGAVHLDERSQWDLEPGTMYTLSRENSALLAFRLGEVPLNETGFRIAGAHTDSPLLKIKNNGAVHENGTIQVTTEVYGGPIFSTWLDRELIMAGQANIKEGGKIVQRTFSTQNPVGIIPNLAIHLNREVNKGFEYNAQDHLKAFLFTEIPDAWKTSPCQWIISRELGCKPEDVRGGDWYLVPAQASGKADDGIGTIWSGRIDNLAGCHGVLRAFLDAGPGELTQVAVFYNHEEIGSASTQGANSQFFVNVLRRILAVTGAQPEDEFLSLAHSLQVSVDAAHSFHPAYANKFDPAYKAVLGKGPVIKQSATQRYATNPSTQGFLEDLCEEAGVELQYMVNRSDIPSGSTIGPISATRSDVATIDVGIPIFAMHSTRETCAAADQLGMITMLTQFYRTR